MDHPRFVQGELGVVELEVRHDDDQITRVNEMRRGAVDSHDARARIPGDGIGRQARAIGDVDNVDLLSLKNPGERWII